MPTGRDRQGRPLRVICPLASSDGLLPVMSGVQAVEGCMNRFTGSNQPEAIRHREAIRLGPGAAGRGATLRRFPATHSTMTHRS